MNEAEDAGKADTIEGDCLFVWDEESKLYFHASTGFYHDPDAGWYYSSRDGLYYTFENRTYVPLTCNKEEKSAALQCSNSISVAGIPSYNSVLNTHKVILTEEAQAWDGCIRGREFVPKSRNLKIEETLIDLYLSGYTNVAVSFDNLPVPQTNEEENWQAQYGQVIQEAEEDFPPFSVVDLWDWEMIVETVKNNHHVARLIGKFGRCSSKLHPCVPARGGLLKTAPIRDVHLDLVRVASGRVYRLRSPSVKYLISLSTYDSSNPTKGWDFPDIFASNYAYTQGSHDQANNLDGDIYASSSTTLDEFCYIAEKLTEIELLRGEPYMVALVEVQDRRVELMTIVMQEHLKLLRKML